MTLAVFGGLAVALALKFVLSRGASPAQVKAKLAAGATVVDVRTEAEFGGGAVEGAINVPLHQLSAKLKKIPKDRPVVVYCASGARSAAAARILKGAGYADVTNAGGYARFSRVAGG
ncbi:MAG: rhodanese-like domain-containing protein [Anaeromyxobacteraceae bacterium]